MCQVAGVSRASYYRHREVVAPDEAEMAARAAIQEVALTHRRRYGYRRVTKDLHRQGMIINHKRVSRIMREDNLLAIRYRKYILTTDSQHDCQVYLNLAARMTVTGVNQLWVADITYIRLRVEFVFLAVIIDRFSRKAIGWALDRTLAARVAVTALQQAIVQRQPPPGVVHHSDQGIQYACADYAALLQANGMVPSMSRPANPYDNAACESFMKTLKQEEIYCNVYRDFEELAAHLDEFIGNYYNRLRLHSALGYRTPEEFEHDTAGAAACGGACAAATMKFFTPQPQEAPVSGSSPVNHTELQACK
jgi:transposase InsO family protein